MVKLRKIIIPGDDFINVEPAKDGIKNVVVFGESGVGKSSLVNLIAGSKVSQTSSGALGCTLNYTRRHLSLDDRKFAIWDTAGLDEGTQGSVPAEKAEAYLKELLHELAKTDGVDLLVYCVRGTRVRSALLTNYHVFYSAICRRKVPIAIVVTGLENQEGDMETWWRDNAPQFAKLKMFFAGHACVTTLESSGENVTLEQRREVSRAAVTRMIVRTCRTQQWKPLERSWMESAYSDIRAMLSPRDSPNARLSNIILCEMYGSCRPVHTRPGFIGRRYTLFFQNPNPIPLSLSPLSLRSPISFSNKISRSKLPFKQDIKYTPERQYRVYQVSPDNSEEGTPKVTVVKRGADLLVFCVKMEDSRSIKSQWEYFNVTYGGDLSPLIVVVIGAPDQECAEKWWKDTVGAVFAKDDVHLAYLPKSTASADLDGARQRLQQLMDDSCIDCSRVTFTKNGELFRRSLHLDISGLASLLFKQEKINKEGEEPASEQDMLTELHVWNEVPDRSPGAASLEYPKEYF